MPLSLTIIAVFTGSYLVGSIPCAYLLVKAVTGQDIREHGSGNIGAMNVKRATDSWGYFVIAMLADVLKGFVPTSVAVCTAGGLVLAPATSVLAYPDLLVPQVAVLGAVLGHVVSLWMALLSRRLGRTGKGLATGAGALAAYDWRYFLAVLIVGLVVIALTRYMLAGQVAATVTLPVTALTMRSADWPFALGMGAIVYLAHHNRFVGLIRGREPKLYTRDGMGPRG